MSMKFKKFNNPVADQTPWYLLPLDDQLEYIDSFAPEELKENLIFFAHNGFIVIENTISKKVAKDAIDGFNDLVKNNPKAFEGATEINPDDERTIETGLYHRIGNTHLSSKRIANAFIKNKALSYVNFIFQSKPALYTSLYYQRGSAQDIHRDTPYFTTRPMNYYVGFSISLEPSNDENGCLEVMRGGHLVDEIDLDNVIDILNKDTKNLSSTDDETWAMYQEMMKKSCLDAGLKIEPLHTNTGDTIIWHPQLPHGGSVVRSVSPRNSLITHVTPVGMPVYLQDVFFNPSKEVSEYTDWKYGEFKNCFVRYGDSININNIRNVSIRDLDSDVLQ